MEYTIVSQKTISIVTDGFDVDGLPIWHAEESETGDKTEVVVETAEGESMSIYIDSVIQSEIDSEVEKLMNAQ